MIIIDGSIVKSKLGPHKEWISTVQWSSKSSYKLLCGSYDGSCKLWDIRSLSQPLYTFSKNNSANESKKILDLEWFNEDEECVCVGEECQLNFFKLD